MLGRVETRLVHGKIDQRPAFGAQRRRLTEDGDDR
jgi:hypothetical protein